MLAIRSILVSGSAAKVQQVLAADPATLSQANTVRLNCFDEILPGRWRERQNSPAPGFCVTDENSGFAARDFDAIGASRP